MKVPFSMAEEEPTARVAKLVPSRRVLLRVGCPGPQSSQALLLQPQRPQSIDDLPFPSDGRGLLGRELPDYAVPFSCQGLVKEVLGNGSSPGSLRRDPG